MRSLVDRAATVALTLACVATTACAPSPERTGSESSALSGPVESFFVVLEGGPAADRIEAGMDPRSPEVARATRARVAELEALHAEVRPVVEAHGGVVVAELTRLANVIQVLATREDAARIERLPGVVRVESVPLAEPTLASAIPVVGAPEVWSKTTPLQGDGITIGIVDSGIDYTHADFAGIGTAAAYAANDATVIEAGSFPTARVVGGWDFVGDDYDPSANMPNPHPDPDPLDCTQPENEAVSGGHGTHVTGIAAGNGVLVDGSAFAGPYEATFNPAAFRVAPGVAPRASLYALKIFGCTGSTTMLSAALERAADPNEDGAFDDRLDVINASLGTAYALSTPIQHEAVSNLTKVGTLMVAAAGNEGQTFFSHSSPGAYPEVLSVAASADNEFLTLSVTTPAAAEYPAAEGGFTTLLVMTGPISGELVQASPVQGCSAFTNPAAIAGKIALIERGTCPFLQKFGNAVAAGAIAAVIIDDQDDPLPFAMGGGDPGSISIPGVLVRQIDGMALQTALGQGPVNVALDPAKKYLGIGAELLAGFSARGPSPSDGHLKPDIAAPGLAIDSARVGSGIEPRRSQGTSMASPFVAGAAALVRQAQPALGPAEVKAALVNSTEPLLDLSSQIYGTSVVGSGRLAVERAVDQLVTALADPVTGEVGVSFGAVVSDEPTTVKKTFVINNTGTMAASLTATIEPTYALPGVEVLVSPATIDVPSGQGKKLELTLSLDPKALGNAGPDPGTAATQGQGMSKAARHFLNEANGRVRLKDAAGGTDVLVPYNGSVRAAARRKATAPSSCAAGSASEPVTVTLEGQSAHPAPVVTAFQLGALDEEDPDSAKDPTAAVIDLRAVGAATDLATAPTFEEASVYFGVAVSGTWTTPARGAISVVYIEIDSKGGASADYAIRAEPRNPDGPYRDVLVASTYDLATGERISRRPLNIATPDIAQTYPFYNSVLVLSSLLSELGVVADKPVFRYAAVSESPDKLTKGERSSWTEFDASKPLLATAAHGMNGAPLFLGDGPILVDVSPEATADQALDLLLLHHTNVAGERFEVVSLVRKAAGNLTLTASGPPTLARSATGAVALVVTNGGSEAAANVKVTGTVTGGTLAAVEAAQGSCAAGTALDCVIGDMAPGATVTLTATVRPASAGAAVTVDAAVASDLACETATEDNSAKATLSIDDVNPLQGHPVLAGGGCGCRVGGASRDGTTAAWLLGLAGVLVGRLRTRKSRASRVGRLAR